ncbi:AAA family ATPase [Candidatus Dojkabacteria bacterium]|nr:AAA family ATPase [Candidatus Dojkabacteria bacterium]
MNITIDRTWKSILSTLEKDIPPFTLITGKAGTGKSTLLTHFFETTSKNSVLLAPTGAAAVNIGGQTIHSFFGFTPATTIKDVFAKAKNKSNNVHKVIEKLDCIIIDEISMVRADLLDFVDTFLRISKASDQPFGGLPIIAFGDLYQLPPILQRDEMDEFSIMYESPYFFSSQVIKRITKERALSAFTLDTIYRQRDEKFINILNSIREGNASFQGLTYLNQNCFKLTSSETDSIYLTTTNQKADMVNEQRLATISNPVRTYTAYVSGDFKENAFPTQEILKLKKGARIMMLNNDKDGRWINGTLGNITELKDGSVLVQLDGQAGQNTTHEIFPNEWEIFKTSWDNLTKSLKKEVVGSFIQLPIRLAWAITIHKSQGKTFEKVVIDLERGAFSEGQTYVALSRCTSLEGLTLSRPVKPSDIKVDQRITDFLQSVSSIV